MDLSVVAAGLLDGSSGPLYRRLAERVIDAVRRGEIGAGSRLPSERDLARSLGISRTTVIAAYRLLREEGVLRSGRGSGTYVTASGRWSGPAVPGVTMPSTKVVSEPPPGVLDLASSVIAGFDKMPDLTVDAEELRALATGSGYQPTGWPPLRAAVAARYTRLGLPTSPDEVLVTTGAQQAIQLLCLLFGRHNGVIVTENPTYAGVLDAARTANAAVVGVPTDADGVTVRGLRDTLDRTNAALLYVMTACQNPTGAVMGAARRHELAHLVERTGTPVVDDLTLADLTSGTPSPGLAAGPGTVTVGSLSKVFWPGLRVGWLRAPGPLLARLARLKVVADLGSSTVSQLLAARLLPLLPDVAAIRREQLTERLAVVEELLRDQLPSWSWRRPSGGPFLWVRLPHGDSDAFAHTALRHGVRVLAGTRASPDQDFADHLRLSFVADPTELRAAVTRLQEAWTEFESHSDSQRQSLDAVV